MFRILVKNKILVTVVVLIVGAVGYYYFFASYDVPSQRNIEQMQEGEKVFAALEIYRNLDFGSSLFSKPVYTSLEDMTAPVPPQQSGRDDPFSSAE